MLSIVRNGHEHDAWFIARGLDLCCITGSGLFYDFHTDHFVEGEDLLFSYSIDAPDMIPAGSCYSDECIFAIGDVFTSQSRVKREKGGAA